MAEDHGFLRRGRIVCRREPPAASGPHADRRKRPVGHDQRPDFLRLAHSRHVRRAGVPHAEVLKRLVVRTIGEVHRRRQPDVVRGHALELRGVPHRDQRVGIRVRQRADQDSVDDGEDRRGRAGAESQRGDGRGGEARIPADHAERERKVARDALDPSDAVHPEHLLANEQRVPELPPRGDPGLVGRHSRTGVLLGEQLEVRFELEARLLVDAAA